MASAELIVTLAGWWLIAGSFVAVAFLFVGIDRIDEDARGAYVFRPLLVPAILLIWPMVLWRWIRLELGLADENKRYRPPRAIHFPTALVLALVLAVAVASSIAVRQTWPVDVEPQQLSEPGQ